MPPSFIGSFSYCSLHLSNTLWYRCRCCTQNVHVCVYCLKIYSPISLCSQFFSNLGIIYTMSKVSICKNHSMIYFWTTTTTTITQTISDAIEFEWDEYKYRGWEWKKEQEEENTNSSSNPTFHSMDVFLTQDPHKKCEMNEKRHQKRNQTKLRHFVHKLSLLYSQPFA